MKRSGFIIFLLMAAFTGKVAAMDQLTGEHLNGEPYYRYSGVSEVKDEVLAAVEDALKSFSVDKADDDLKRVLDKSDSVRWSKVGPEYLEPSPAKDGCEKTLVGVRYQKGPLICVFYQNQISVVFELEAEGGVSTLYYYLSKGERIEVRNAYSF